MPPLSRSRYTGTPARKDGFEFNSSDLELVRYAYELKLATVDDLAALASAPAKSPREGRSHKALRRRLLKLHERGYLASREQKFKQKNVYAVGTKASPRSSTRA
jgi:hypothetical protein